MDYILDCLAYDLQYPAEPRGVVLAFGGVQGAGKNTMTDFLGEYIYGPAITVEINGIEPLLKDFNAFLCNAKALIINEIGNSGDNWKKHFNKIKTTVTDKRILVERKGIDAVMNNNGRFEKKSMEPIFSIEIFIVQ